MTQTDLQKKASFKSKVLSSSIWTLGGYALAQIIRLLSNIILARLLFPEAFGLMTLVMVFMQGISMFSDIGITPSIIQNKRGSEPSFLNTAWTFQIIRGFVLWFIALIGAYPYSLIYSEPSLAYLIPVSGITAIILGFNSTALSTANKELNLRNITLLDLIAQSVSVCVMICWVWISPTVWGLVAGGILSALIKMVLSHLWISKRANHLCWNKDDARELFNFGKWIFASSALTFFTNQVDRILLGYFFGTATLGIYSIAVMFKESSIKATQMLGGRVLFPSYSKIINNGDNERFHRALKKTRLILIIATWLVSFSLIFLGAELIGWLYDDRYSEAVWMLQVMPLGALIGVLSLTYRNVYLAKGKSSYMTILSLFQLTFQVIGIVTGNHIAGIYGVVIGLAIVEWLMYPANVIAARKLKIWQPEIDIPIIVIAILLTTSYLMSSDILIME